MEVKISGYVYHNGSFMEGSIVVDEGIVKEITFSRDNNAPIKGVIIPKPHNAHAHLLDYIAKDLTEERDLIKLVAPPNGIKHKVLNSASKEDLLYALKVAREHFLRYKLGLITEFRELGIIGASLGKPHDLFRVLTRPKSVEEAKSMIEYSDGFNISAISDVNYEFSKEISKIAKSHGKIFGMHFSERIREDIDLVLDLEPDFLVHAIAVTTSDLRKIAEHDIPVVICPRSNAYFGRLPRVDKMIELGIRVLLGTDNHMMNTINVFEEAEFLYKTSLIAGIKINAMDIVRMLFRDFKEDFSIDEGISINKVLVIEDLRGKPELILLNRHSSSNVYDLSSPKVAMRSA